MMKICKRCVMDTTDRNISFDSNGICNHCNEFDAVTRTRWFPNSQGKLKLENMFNRVKDEGKNKKYDCILGLSGGLDSSYLALIMKDYGLRPLVVHIDAGWNTDSAIRNITTVVEHCGYELHTKIVDWNEIKDLQLSYLKSGVANQDVVQDHAFFANLYHFSIENNINYVINGGNIATESIFPKSWHHSAMDSINIKAIHKKFGRAPLKNYTLINFFDYYFYFPFIKKMKVLRPLNFMPYSKEIALERLQEIGYLSYERKHGESHFTKFFQNYYLPVKFNMDKRKPHLSSLIMSGIITRDEALNILGEPLYDPQELISDKKFIADRLEISLTELDNFIESPNHDYSEYANWDNKYKLMKKIQSGLLKVLQKKISNYS